VTFLIDHFDLFGLRQVWLELRGKPHTAVPFVTPWLYRRAVTVNNSGAALTNYQVPIALDSAFRSIGLDKGVFTIIVGHATFCVVVVYNNVLARLRRLGGSFEEASADLGADAFQTFRYITLPLTRSALFAGGLLAFALSFDEIIVTTFTAGPGITTLPIWIFNNLFRPNQAPVVNVVAAILVVLSVVPVWLAQRVAGPSAGTSRT